MVLMCSIYNHVAISCTHSGVAYLSYTSRNRTIARTIIYIYKEINFLVVIISFSTWAYRVVFIITCHYPQTRNSYQSSICYPECISDSGICKSKARATCATEAMIKDLFIWIVLSIMIQIHVYINRRVVIIIVGIIRAYGYIKLIQAVSI